MPQAGILPPVTSNQRQSMAVDFGSFLPLGVTLVGTPTLKLGISAGNDRNPQSRVTNGPVVGTAPIAQGGTGIADCAVIFQVGGCIPGVTYAVDVYCARSDGDIAEGSTKFSCNEP